MLQGLGFIRFRGCGFRVQGFPVVGFPGLRHKSKRPHHEDPRAHPHPWEADPYRASVRRYWHLEALPELGHGLGSRGLGVWGFRGLGG